MQNDRITFKELQRRDFDIATKFALTGMHLDRYASGLALKLYAKDVFCEALARCTLPLAAYDGNRLTGFLLAAFEGEAHPYARSAQARFHRMFTALSKLVPYAAAEEPYDRANEEMREELPFEPDGEIVLFAADPACQGRGIGTKLLDELSRLRPGKRVFLYTDDACTYRFYESRGFDRMGKRRVELPLPQGNLSMESFLYAKTLPESSEQKERA